MAEPSEVVIWAIWAAGGVVEEVEEVEGERDLGARGRDVWAIISWLRREARELVVVVVLVLLWDADLRISSARSGSIWEDEEEASACALAGVEEERRDEEEEREEEETGGFRKLSLVGPVKERKRELSTQGLTVGSRDEKEKLLSSARIGSMEEEEDGTRSIDDAEETSRKCGFKLL